MIFWRDIKDTRTFETINYFPKIGEKEVIYRANDTELKYLWVEEEKIYYLYMPVLRNQI